jgi:hypothetical protein
VAASGQTPCEATLHCSRGARCTCNANLMCSAAEKGLSVAVSPTAVERLLTLRQAKKDAAAKAAEAGPTAKMASVRLTKDDIGARLIPLAGTLGQATADVRPVSPKLSCSGNIHLPALSYSSSVVWPWTSVRAREDPRHSRGWTPLTAIMMLKSCYAGDCEHACGRWEWYLPGRPVARRWRPGGVSAKVEHPGTRAQASGPFCQQRSGRARDCRVICKCQGVAAACVCSADICCSRGSCLLLASTIGLVLLDQMPQFDALRISDKCSQPRECKGKRDLMCRQTRTRRS